MNKRGNPVGEELVLFDRRMVKSKRNKKRGDDGEVELLAELQDPLALFGRDIMMNIFSGLDANSVALSLLVSHSWNGVASSDTLWKPKCDELWIGKAHIPRSSQVRGLSKLHVYNFSVMDGRRSRITREDLCDHAWEFHYKMAAPQYWRNLDPYWEGTNPLMRRYFNLDGSLTADPTDEVWGGHECCYTIVTGILGDNNEIREHYVRVNRWPRLAISRKLDWGWEMSNKVFSYSSIPDADLEGGTGPLFVFA